MASRTVGPSTGCETPEGRTTFLSEWPYPRVGTETGSEIPEGGTKSLCDGLTHVLTVGSLHGGEWPHYARGGVWSTKKLNHT